MESELNKVGYSVQWINLGILDQEFFKSQIEKQRESDHEGWEHYRYGAYLNWERMNDSFTDKSIHNITTIVSQDSDQPMARSFLKELMASGKLTNHQVEKLNEFLRNT